MMTKMETKETITIVVVPKSGFGNIFFNPTVSTYITKVGLKLKKEHYISSCNMWTLNEHRKVSGLYSPL